MKLIVGLGNPGLFYRNSRHNIGFSVVKSLVRKSKAAFKKDILSLSARAKIGAESAVIAMPLSFMNLSGLAVVKLLEKYGLDHRALLVVCDDLDLEFGRLKLRLKGSSAGHRGVQSVIDCLSSEEFSRLRIGIGRPAAGKDVSKFVLSSFSGQEKRGLKEVLDDAGSACVSWIKEGKEKTMSRYNRKALKRPGAKHEERKAK